MCLWKIGVFHPLWTMPLWMWQAHVNCFGNKYETEANPRRACVFYQWSQSKRTNHPSN